MLFFLLFFIQLLLFAFQVVFGQVTALAHAARVVRPIGMRAGSGQTRLAFSVVAVVAHVFGVVPHVLMVTNEKLAHLLGILLYFLQAFMTVLEVKCLQLESTDGILVEVLDLPARDLCRLGSDCFDVSRCVDLAYLVELFNC